MVNAPGTVADAVRWIYEFVMRPHGDLGRKGAVCPFMELAMRKGQVSITPVHLDTEHDAPRLRAAVLDGLRRVSATSGSEAKAAAVFVPVGTTDLVGRMTLAVQRELRDVALDNGCIVGEFVPDHPAGGVRNPDFRPLASPVAMVGIRELVDSDIVFLGSPDVPPARRLVDLQLWHSRFGASAGPPLLERYEQLRTAAQAQLAGS